MVPAKLLIDALGMVTEYHVFADLVVVFKIIVLPLIETFIVMYLFVDRFLMPMLWK